MVIIFFKFTRLFFSSLFSLFFQPCLIHARMPELGGGFEHGHTFLHSRRAADIGRPAAWSYVPAPSYSSSFRIFYGTLEVEKDT